MDIDKKNVMCARSVVYSVKGLHANILYHAAEKRGRGADGARGGGWLGLAASFGLLMEIYMFCELERA
jgi:hypothetical protein